MIKNTNGIVGAIFVIIVMIMYICVPLLVIYGYVMNFVYFVGLDFNEPYKAEIIRGIGVLSGVGAIVGYIDIKDN